MPKKLGSGCPMSQDVGGGGRESEPEVRGQAVRVAGSESEIALQTQTVPHK